MTAKLVSLPHLLPFKSFIKTSSKAISSGGVRLPSPSLAGSVYGRHRAALSSLFQCSQHQSCAGNLNGAGDKCGGLVDGEFHSERPLSL